MAKSKQSFSRITPEIQRLAVVCEERGKFAPALYEKYDVKRGLRDNNGDGVVAGLTAISNVKAKEIINGEMVPVAGSLSYRGYQVEDIIDHLPKDSHFGYETVTYLLLFGDMPTKEQLDEFCGILADYRSLPTGFVRDVIMKAPSANMMNALARSVLTLYSYDANADDTSIPNVLRQCLQLIATFPLLSVYGYHTDQHYHHNKSLIIHRPLPELSTAENILRLLRPNTKYTALEARVLDLALVLHAEHGGGNNSSFTTHVVTSSGTDTYSAIAAALGSLKGPKHGGANIKVEQMFADLKEHISDWNDDEAISAYLNALLNKEAFDKKGLIYGIGHAIYSISDPRARVFRQFVEALSEEKGLKDEFALYAKVEELAPRVIAENRKMYKGVSANVDFYSGFVYRMLGLPSELFTPVFAIARIAGWSAHRIEELVNAGKIIRPAYKSVSEPRVIG